MQSSDVPQARQIRKRYLSATPDPDGMPRLHRVSSDTVRMRRSRSSGASPVVGNARPTGGLLTPIRRLFQPCPAGTVAPEVWERLPGTRRSKSAPMGAKACARSPKQASPRAGAARPRVAFRSGTGPGPGASAKARTSPGAGEGAEGAGPDMGEGPVCLPGAAPATAMSPALAAGASRTSPVQKPARRVLVVV